jgi:hypothetical protein
MVYHGSSRPSPHYQIRAAVCGRTIRAARMRPLAEPYIADNHVRIVKDHYIGTHACSPEQNTAARCGLAGDSEKWIGYTQGTRKVNRAPHPKDTGARARCLYARP